MGARRIRYMVLLTGLAVAVSPGLAAVSVWAPGATAATAATPQWPTHRCGSFTHRKQGKYPVTYRIAVLNGAVSCKTATGVVRAFWSGKGVTQHGGPSDAQSYWTLVAWPGWRCQQDAGAGSCSRGKAIAAYEVGAG